ncbi:MAG: hypothetical protein HY986_25760 [Candidatus Melainabacteria bacterium]|nr:hypothetical protein [Candidatus Melainabacteria bacterium]
MIDSTFIREQFSKIAHELISSASSDAYECAFVEDIKYVWLAPNRCFERPQLFRTSEIDSQLLFLAEIKDSVDKESTIRKSVGEFLNTLGCTSFLLTTEEQFSDCYVRKFVCVYKYWSTSRGEVFAPFSGILILRGKNYELLCQERKEIHGKMKARYSHSPEIFSDYLKDLEKSAVPL